MTTQRPYAPALSAAEAEAELRRGAGTQFDPHVADVFCTEVASAGRQSHQARKSA